MRASDGAHAEPNDALRRCARRAAAALARALSTWRAGADALCAPPGGLDELVTEAVLHAAFLPFGELKDVSVPVDHGTQKNRGFGFVTFIEPCAPALALTLNCPPRRAALTRVTAARASCSEDCAAAMDNMHNAELYGRVLRCNYAQPQKIRGGEAGFSNQPVWADADNYQNALEAEGGGQE